MTLQQALRFFEQSVDTFNKARTRLDKANSIIAARILSMTSDSEEIYLDGFRIWKQRIRSNSGFSEAWLYISDNESFEGAIDCSSSFYWAGDFHCEINPAPRETKIWFAANINRILRAFAEQNSEQITKMNNSASVVESLTDES